jgi:hypothetical protein
MWNLEGLTVRGTYFGLPVEGVVTESRVKYGGTVQHTVDLFQPISLFSTSEHRTTVLLDANEVTFIEYESVTACEFD